jgi:hypothetical protein
MWNLYSVVTGGMYCPCSLAVGTVARDTETPSHSKDLYSNNSIDVRRHIRLRIRRLYRADGIQLVVS